MAEALIPDAWSAKNYNDSLEIMAREFGLSEYEMIRLHNGIGSLAPWISTETLMEIIALIGRPH